MRHLPSALVLLLVCGWSQFAVAQSDADKLVGELDPAIQAQIRATVLAFLSGGRSESEVRTNWKGYRELEELKRLAGDDERLLNQLAAYTVAEQRQDEAQVVEASLLLELLHLKPMVPIRVLAPYLDSDDKPLRNFARDWFERHSRSGTVGGRRALAANYIVYSDYIRLTLNVNGELPIPLVEYMYEHAPQQALLVLLRVYRRPQLQEQNDAIRCAAQIVENAIRLREFDKQFQESLPEAKEYLAKLAGHSEFWARRYAVEIMRRYPEFRLNQALQKLRKDEDDSVRKVAESITG